VTQVHRPKGSRLGFGTGPFSGRGDRAHQVKLIHAALDAGITHIDTARLYGDGTAEGIVGEAIKGRRQNLFLVSKAGIEPPVNGNIRRAMNKALSLGRKLPRGAGVLPAPQWNEPAFGRFDVAYLRSSLETSLRALKTDHLDLFLLHEVDAQHLASGDVIDALERWSREGLFASYGIASTRDQTRRILGAGSLAPQAIQTDLTAFTDDPLDLVKDNRLVVTHSWLGRPLARFQKAFEVDPKLAEKAGRCLYADVRRPHRLARCLLEHALSANPDGQVLFTTSKTERIEKMAAVAERPRMTPQQLSALGSVVQRILEIEAEMV